MGEQISLGESGPEEAWDVRFARLRGELERRLMIDDGINPDTEKGKLQEWMLKNSNEISKYFTPKMALKLETDPSEVVFEIKQKLRS